MKAQFEPHAPQLVSHLVYRETCKPSMLCCSKDRVSISGHLESWIYSACHYERKSHDPYLEFFMLEKSGVILNLE